MFSILKACNLGCILYRVPEAKLRKYSTLKSDNEKKNYKRPPKEMIDHQFIPVEDFKFSLIQDALCTPTNFAGESVEGSSPLKLVEPSLD